MKKVTILLLTLIAVTISANAAKKKRVKAYPVPPTIEIITKVNDYWQQNHKPEVRSFWDEAAYHTGNMEAYKLLQVQYLALLILRGINFSLLQ